MLCENAQDEKRILDGYHRVLMLDEDARTTIMGNITMNQSHVLSIRISDDAKRFMIVWDSIGINSSLDSEYENQ